MVQTLRKRCAAITGDPSIPQADTADVYRRSNFKMDVGTWFYWDGMKRKIFWAQLSENQEAEEIFVSWMRRYRQRTAVSNGTTPTGFLETSAWFINDKYWLSRRNSASCSFLSYSLFSFMAWCIQNGVLLFNSLDLIIKGNLAVR